MEHSPGVTISPRVRRAYLGATGAYGVAAVAFAAVQVWVVAGAFAAMGGAMVVAARQMRDRPAPIPAEPEARQRP